MPEQIRFTLNDKPVSLRTDPARKLLWVLRTDLELTGAKYGCGEGQCAACTVVVDGQAVPSCLTAVGDVRGKRVMTIEGLARAGRLHPLQEAFMEHGALQCGYCTSGMLLGAWALLQQTPHPTAEQIAQGLEGHLCRCGTHQRVIAAVQDAAGAAVGGSHD